MVTALLIVSIQTAAFMIHTELIILKQQIQAKEQAIRIDGVHLIGYTPWSAFDIVSEMEKRYGFIYVDKQDDGTGTLKRMKKDSFYWYQKVIRSNGETL